MGDAATKVCPNLTDLTAVAPGTPRRPEAPGLNFAGELGKQLALMHLTRPQNDHADEFGFHVDNTIGGTPQPNGWMSNWVEFFRERRLRHQLQLADNHRLNELAEPLLKPGALETFFEDIDVKPSVLHGITVW